MTTPTPFETWLAANNAAIVKTKDVNEWMHGMYATARAPLAKAVRELRKHHSEREQHAIIRSNDLDAGDERDARDDERMTSHAIVFVLDALMREHGIAKEQG